MERPKTKLDYSSAIHIVGLAETGGCWIPSGRFYTDEKLAKELCEIERASGGKDKVFTLYEAVRDEPKTPSDLTFKVDNKAVKVGQDMRVEVDLGDGESLCIVLTHEGIITDYFKNGKATGTSSCTYDEKADGFRSEDE